VIVKKLRTGRVAYCAHISYRDHRSLGAAGTLATTISSTGAALTGRVGWYSPGSRGCTDAEPRGGL
jgi:hypothetical protein